MPEEKSLRIEVTSTFFASPNRVNSAEWRAQVREVQNLLGALASNDAGVQVSLSIDGSLEEVYDSQHAERLEDSRLSQELAEKGGLLDLDITSLLSHADQTEIARKNLTGKLNNCGLRDVRAILATGYGTLSHSKAGKLGEKSLTVLKTAMESLGITPLKAPSAEDVALFCDSLEQIPGQVLIRIGEENKRAALNKQGPYFFDVLETFKHIPWMWTELDIVKLSIDQLSAMSLDALTAVIFEQRGQYYNSGRDMEAAKEAAQALQSTVKQYIHDFFAAKEAHNSKLP